MTYILDQLSFFAFFQCLLLITVFIFSQKKRQHINLYLLILVIVLLIGLLGKIGQSLFNWGRQIKGLSEFSILLFGPTVYLFVQSTLSEKRFSKRDLVYYVPGLVYSIIITFYYILPPSEIIVARAQSGELYRVIGILVGTGLAVNLTFYILSILKFRALKKSLQSEVSYVVNVNFVKNFMIAIGGCLLIWVTVYFLSITNFPEIEIISREFIWLAIALIILFLAYYQMVSPSVFQFERLSKASKYALSKFTQEDLDHLKLKLEEVMHKKKPYLNSKLLKSELAVMLDINAPDLSRLLNERIGMNFFEYINYHRIHEFIRLAKSPKIEEKTLLGLAQEAGFHSKSTFNKSFKQIMGCPPSEYIKNSI